MCSTSVELYLGSIFPRDSLVLQALPLEDFLISNSCRPRHMGVPTARKKLVQCYHNRARYCLRSTSCRKVKHQELDFRTC